MNNSSSEYYYSTLMYHALSNGIQLKPLKRIESERSNKNKIFYIKLIFFFRKQHAFPNRQ